MTDEEWKSIPSTYGFYEASSLGRIRRAKGGRNARIGFVLKPYKNRYGYLSVGLHFDVKLRTFLLHRLVAEAFIGTCPSDMEVNHLNCDKLDNRLSNLEYCTRSENLLHASRNGILNTPRGSRHCRAKLHECDVSEIRRLYASGIMQKDIAHIYGIDQSNVSYIITGKRWCHVAFLTATTSVENKNGRP